jgi:hypothetical protein
VSPDRTDYAANRGPLGRPEYTRRRPDPFSCCAGTLAIIMSAGIVVVVIGLIATRLLGG